MNNATVLIGKSHYKMEVVAGSGNSFFADEPEEVGGMNLGSSPDELLCAALGACTAATLRMYADRKEWPLEGVAVEVSFERKNAFAETNMVRKITLAGNLSEEQRERLMDIANKCPLHKTLSHPIRIETIQ